MARLPLLLIPVLLTIAQTTAEQCSFAAGNYNAIFGVRGDTVYFRVSIAIGNAAGLNAWTGIGFGQSMRSGLDVIVIRLTNGRVLVSDEYVQGYSRPVADRINNVQVGNTNFVNGVLHVSFSRKIMTFDQMDQNLSGCTTWQFVTSLSQMSPGGALFHHSTRPVSRLVCLQNCITA